MRELNFRRRPSTAAFMLRALVPAGWRRRGRFPSLRATWSPVRFGGNERATFARLTGLANGTWQAALLPQVLGFPLLLTILTDPRFPMPIWGALQIRNRILYRRPYSPESGLRLEAAVVEQRVLENGVEVDLRLALLDGSGCAWESVTSFYYRGKFGTPEEASRFAATPEPGGEVLRQWRTASDGRWRFSRLSGDHNWIHGSDRLARLQGYRKALLHPQRILAECLARSPFDAPPLPVRLDGWIKGPVFYGERVGLVGRQVEAGGVLALRGDWDPRPPLVVAWRAARSTESLVDHAAAGGPGGEDVAHE